MLEEPILIGDSDFDWLRPPAGGWHCRCGKATEHPGMCQQCADEDQERDRKRAISARVMVLPVAFRWASFDSEDLERRSSKGSVTKAKKVAEGLCGGRVSGVTFLGPAGSGKTSLACAMLRTTFALPIGFSPLFCGSIALSRARQDSGLGHTPQEIHDAIHASIIVLDDVGQEPARLSDSVAEVIHERHNDSKPTIITSGLSADELVHRYGDGTARRMFERSALLQLKGKAS